MTSPAASSKFSVLPRAISTAPLAMLARLGAAVSGNILPWRCAHLAILPLAVLAVVPVLLDTGVDEVAGFWLARAAASGCLGGGAGTCLVDAATEEVSVTPLLGTCAVTGAGISV